MFKHIKRAQQTAELRGVSLINGGLNRMHWHRNPNQSDEAHYPLDSTRTQ